MRRVASMFNHSVAAALCSLLQDADIHTTITTESANPYTGMTSFIVFVEQDVDTATVTRLLQAFESQYKLNANQPTQVHLSDPRKCGCKSCKYDLRGQTTDGLCPECAYPYHISADWRCPTCNAENPGDFDICWQCEGEVSPEPD